MCWFRRQWGRENRVSFQDRNEKKVCLSYSNVPRSACKSVGRYKGQKVSKQQHLQGHLKRCVKRNRGTSNSDPLEECQLKCQRYVNDFVGKVRSLFPRVWWKLFEVVKSAKILGVTVREDLKWNEHIDIITVKASEAHGCWQSITDLIFLSCIKSVLEYACQSFHSSLPAY